MNSVKILSVIIFLLITSCEKIEIEQQSIGIKNKNSELIRKNTDNEELTFENLTLEKIESIPFFDYRVNSTVDFYLKPDRTSPKNDSYVSVLFLIENIEETTWYLCISKEGQKGYVDILGVPFMESNYNPEETEIIREDSRFKRTGPVLIVKSKNGSRVFKNNFAWEDSDYYHVVQANDYFFTLHHEGFESNRYLVYTFFDLYNEYVVSGIPIQIGISQHYITCGRYFFPPDVLIVFEYSDGKVLIKHKEVVHVKTDKFYIGKPKVKYKNGAIHISYVGFSDVLIPFNIEKY